MEREKNLHLARIKRPFNFFPIIVDAAALAYKYERHRENTLFSKKYTTDTQRRREKTKEEKTAGKIFMEIKLHREINRIQERVIFS